LLRNPKLLSRKESNMSSEVSWVLDLPGSDAWVDPLLTSLGLAQQGQREAEAEIDLARSKLKAMRKYEKDTVRHIENTAVAFHGQEAVDAAKAKAGA